MYWLRYYELLEENYGHQVAGYRIQDSVGPGFLNMINRYYGYRVWR
uniref:Uncharacterized protein n=1 Tax=viral metagenome TaxID=1070528 RepID=A0A6H2A3H3_9ZZZZ